MRPKFVLDRTLDGDADMASQRRRPLIILTRQRAAFVVVASYTAAILIARYFFIRLQSFQGPDDTRVDQVTFIFAGFMAGFAAWSLYSIFRRPKTVDV
jgi:hypothetical protein